ncbi:MAG: glycosyl transferase [Leptolyngbya sp. LCM1.Bin17]|nr:MAG: glycosyl transferase [Leptolyngbya sp. LCM1.Bin17]
MNEIIKVYVGTQVEQMLTVKVLEYSIQKYTQHPVAVIPLFAAVEAAGIEIPVPTNPHLRPRTPFSFQRFAIPQLNGYEGRAIYLDSDMQVFRDIQELWTWDFAGADVLSVYEPPGSGRPPQFSVMVLNCQQLRWHVADLIHQLEAGRWTYQQFILEMAPADMVAAVLPTEWNDLERFVPGKTALVHYTDMNKQPWLNGRRNPLASLWCQDLLEAVEGGHISRDYVATEVQKGHVRPSLLHQIDHNIADPLQLPPDILQADTLNFVPPHELAKLGVPGATHQGRKRTLSHIIHQIYAKSRALVHR